MTILEGIFIGGIASTLIAVIFSLYFLIVFIMRKAKLKKLPKKPPKNPKKRKRFLANKKQLTLKKKRAFRGIILWFVLALSFGGGAAFVSYYQSTNLTSEDSDAIVRSYYLLRDFQEQLKAAGEMSEEEASIVKNVSYLTTNLASYGTKSASTLNTAEGQLVLNRYYNSLKELGVNASTQTNNFFGNKELTEEFTEDIGRVIEYEKAAFEFYKVDESALKE